MVLSLDASARDTSERAWAWAEIRADLGAPATTTARIERTIFALRSTAVGGRGPTDTASRHAVLRAAALQHARVELEVDRDLVPEVLAAVAPSQRVLAWYGASPSIPELRSTLARMRSTAAAVYKVVTHARTIPQAVAPLALLPPSPGDVIAYDQGPTAGFTRILARALGSALTPVALREFHERHGSRGSQDGSTTDRALLSIDRLLDDYGRQSTTPPTEVYGIVGRSLQRSMSPRLHNRAYEHRGMAALYLPLEHDGATLSWLPELAAVLRTAVSIRLRGLTVTAPLKEAALALAGEARCTPLARACAAVNVLTAGTEPDEWYGDTTDGVGIDRPLRDRGIEVEGRACAVIGCGGAGRAAAVTLRNRGAQVTVLNRSEHRGLRVADELGVAFEPLAALEPGRFEVIVHATPLGKHGEASPFNVLEARPGTTLADFVYRTDRPTPLVAAAQAQGLRTIDGWAVLAAEIEQQISVLTGCHDRALDPTWLAGHTMASSP